MLSFEEIAFKAKNKRSDGENLQLTNLERELNNKPYLHDVLDLKRCATGSELLSPGRHVKDFYFNKTPNDVQSSPSKLGESESSMSIEEDAYQQKKLDALLKANEFTSNVYYDRTEIDVIKNAQTDNPFTQIITKKEEAVTLMQEQNIRNKINIAEHAP